VKPAPLDYVRAGSVEQAAGALAAADGEGKIIAGGQSLMPMLALRLAQPAVLVDINRIPGLASIQPSAAGGLRVGALIRHRALAEQRSTGCSPRPHAGSGMPRHPATRTASETGWRRPVSGFSIETASA
jgi:FAD binding domain in molybdopterin dehydrogenase